jgi:hypothetical protein
MPEFTTEIDIDPSEFIDSCSKRERERLIEILVEDGFIQPDQATLNGEKVRKPNINDERFFNSLDKLSNCRDLLTLEEENYINNLAEKFKHLR